MWHLIIDGKVAETTSESPVGRYHPSFLWVPDNGARASVGWLYSNGQFSPTPAVSKPFPRFVGNQKLDLFTQTEQLAVVSATMTDPMVKLMYDRLLGSSYLSYEDPETEQGLSLLESKGLLTSARKAQIVSQMQPK